MRKTWFLWGFAFANEASGRFILCQAILESSNPKPSKQPKKTFLPPHSLFLFALPSAVWPVWLFPLSLLPGSFAGLANFAKAAWFCKAGLRFCLAGFLVKLSRQLGGSL